MSIPDDAPGSAAARDLFGARFAGISRYVDILSTRGVSWGLLGPREASRIWDRHVLNSVALADLIPPGGTVVDVGSGAGLPGIPLAILRPDLEMTLLEPLLRRATFLEQAVDELGLTDRVRVERSRAEASAGVFSTVISRAVAPLARLVGWCEPLRDPDGVMLALKGRSAADEVEAARLVLDRHRLRAEVLQVRAHPATEATTVVRISSS